MDYIIYDLEFNQKTSTIEDNSTNSTIMPFEIIQIGALKLSENLEVISTFDALIKPTVYTTIHPYVENLTKINIDKLRSCKNFLDVYKDFLDFIGGNDISFCVWGTVDIKELQRNLKFYNLSGISNPLYYIDIQKYASKYLDAPKGSKISLSNAIDLLNIPTKGEFHDAFNDAYYTTEIFKKIYDETLHPTLYVSTPSRRITQPKVEIDLVALFSQFEKMYGREMSQEEKSIIKLSYIMGKTKQFIKKP